MKILNTETSQEFESPGGLDLVTAALRANAKVGYSCRQGICGTCRASIVCGVYKDELTQQIHEVSRNTPPHEVLLCQTVPLGEIELRHNPTSQDQTIYATQINQLDFLADDVCRIQLLTISNIPLRFTAGQFIGIKWANGSTKYFSLAQNSTHGDSNSIELHVRKQEQGEFTQWLFNTAKPGDILGIVGPFGEFTWKTEAERTAVLIATGTGFAPIKSIVESHKLWQTHKSIYLYWGGRTPQDLYMMDLANWWQNNGKDFQFRPALSQNSISNWTGRIGRLPQLIIKDFPDMRLLDVYACGSSAMIESARDIFTRIGMLPKDRFFADVFSGTPSLVQKGTIHVGISFTNSPIIGRIITRPGVGLLEALLNAGIKLDHYCGGGAVCGTCRVVFETPEVAPMEEYEEDLLDCLHDYSQGERLACQITITNAFNGINIKLPGRPARASRLEEFTNETNS